MGMQVDTVKKQAPGTTRSDGQARNETEELQHKKVRAQKKAIMRAGWRR